MIRMAVMAAALGAVGVGGAQAASLATVWQGTLWVTATSDAPAGGPCGTDGWTPAQFYESVYRPYLGANTANNKPEALSLVTHRAAFLFEPASGNQFGSSLVKYIGNRIGGRANIGSWPAAGDNTAKLQLSITSQSIKLNGKSETVYAISGVINDVNNVGNNNPGCTLTVKGVYSQRPD